MYGSSARLVVEGYRFHVDDLCGYNEREIPAHLPGTSEICLNRMKRFRPIRRTSPNEARIQRPSRAYVRGLSAVFDAWCRNSLSTTCASSFTCASR